jgi:hypothetical protein
VSAGTHPEQVKTALVKRYARTEFPPLSCASVRDYCDSADAFPWLSSRQQDLKDVQRPWAVKAILGCLPPGARLLEIGGGEPFAAATLVSLGYDVTICDPFDGSGNGPVALQLFKAQYPGVKFIRSLFTPDVARQFAGCLDGVFSISVLEHVTGEGLAEAFHATALSLKPGGYSIHAIDHVLQGNGQAWHEEHLLRILVHQARLAGKAAPEAELARDFANLLEQARNDLDTFLLSPQGHNAWRGSQTYDAFPFRKCISVQSVVRHVPTGPGARATR